MMYNQKFAAAIKVNGKVLREFKDEVYVPFASEYSILLKNLNTKRAIVTVYIDGEDQTPGGLVIDAGREVNLERSIKNNNLTEGNKFKFIERTGAVEAHRGIKLEDGIVRIEFEFEREQPQWCTNNSSTKWQNPGYNPNNGIWLNNIGAPYTGSINCSDNAYYGVAQASATVSTNSALRSGTTTSASLNSVTFGPQGGTFGDMTNSYVSNDAGITVAGSKSDQQFRTVTGVYGDGTKHNIVLKLLGETADNKPVLKEVTVKAKPKCTTCGRQNKANAKFCAECGTALEIFA